MTVRISDFNEVVCTFAGLPIEGWADGVALTITRTSDVFTSQVGNKGDVARSKTNDHRAEIEIVLQQVSPTNAGLSAIYLADRNAPGGAGIGAFLIVDLNGTSLYTAGNSWIKRPPDPTFDREPTNRTWLLECDAIQDFTGGNI